MTLARSNRFPVACAALAALLSRAPRAAAQSQPDAQAPAQAQEQQAQEQRPPAAQAPAEPAAQGARADTAATHPVEAPAQRRAAPAPPAQHGGGGGSGGGGESRGAPVDVTAGLGRGVTLRTRDDAFSLTIRARVQAQGAFLYDAIRPRGATQDPPPEFGFQVRRARLLLQGHFFSRAWQYYFQLGFSNRDTEPDLRLPLRDFYLTWTSVRDVNVRVGQMKVPFGRQRVVSSSALQFVDRSTIVNELNLDRDVGVVAFSNDLFGLGDVLGYQVGVFSGDGRNRLPTGQSGLLYVARLHLTPFGHFDDLVEADVERRANPRLAVGLAVAYNQNTLRTQSTIGETYTIQGADRRVRGFDYLHAAADLIFKWRGFSLQGELLFRQANESVHTMQREGMAPLEERSRSAWGWMAQAGYLFTEHFEVAGRFGDLVPIDAMNGAPTDPALRRAREAGGALSYYFQEHAFKIQADYFYLWSVNAMGAPDREQHQVRVQAQLYF